MPAFPLAIRGRAEPVAALYEQGRVSHVGGLRKLEEQMCQMTRTGYQGKGFTNYFRDPQTVSPFRGNAWINYNHSGINARLRPTISCGKPMFKYSRKRPTK